MRKGMWTAAGMAGAIVGGMLTIGVAAAQTDAAPAASDATAAPSDAAAAPAKPAAKPKSKPKMMKPMMAKVSVMVANMRTVGLTQLQAGESGSGKVVEIAGPLAAGKTKAIWVAHGKGGCLFDLSATYDDGSTMDATGVDLCADKKINLVE